MSSVYLVPLDFSSLCRTFIKLESIHASKRANFVVHGPTTARFPRDPANNMIQIVNGDSTGEVKYNIAAEAACIEK